MIEGAVIDSSTYNLTVGKIGGKFVYRNPSWNRISCWIITGLNPFHPTTDVRLNMISQNGRWLLGVPNIFLIPFP